MCSNLNLNNIKCTTWKRKIGISFFRLLSVSVCHYTSYTHIDSDKSLEYSDYLSDDDHSVTTGSAFIRRFIPEICSVHFVFLET
jgi:hypothetical protein